MTSKAGLAAYIATGIVVVGFLFFGRAWWGSITILASTVLLALLLVPEAFTAIGLAFALVLLVAAAIVIADQQAVERVKQKQAVF